MKFKLNYIFIPLITILVSWLGSSVTTANMGWYMAINKPAWTPDGAIIGLVWTIIFILTTISAFIIWNKKVSDQDISRRRWALVIFGLNAVLNVGWSWLFFGRGLFGLATIEAVLLGLSVATIILLVRPFSRLAAGLLYPYVLWVFFASYLTYQVWLLN